MFRTVQKVCGGGGGWWLRPILVFSLSLDQAEQYLREKAWQDRPNHSTPDPQTAVVRELQQTDNDNAIFVVADQS